MHSSDFRHGLYFNHKFTGQHSGTYLEAKLEHLEISFRLQKKCLSILYQKPKILVDPRWRRKNVENDDCFGGLNRIIQKNCRKVLWKLSRAELKKLLGTTDKIRRSTPHKSLLTIWVVVCGSDLFIFLDCIKREFINVPYPMFMMRRCRDVDHIIYSTFYFIYYF